MTKRPPSPRATTRGQRGTSAPVSDLAFERAAALFRAAGDQARLRLLHQLDAGECCVSDLAEARHTKLSTLSQQLRVLHAERIVTRRREGKQVFYSLADGHVRELIRAALEHAGETPVNAVPTQRRKEP
jgi:ArsR family transcriptional regulator, lead/cadmium/zinc/bismuth-responsive transcriptional repressor